MSEVFYLFTENPKEGSGKASNNIVTLLLFISDSQSKFHKKSSVNEILSFVLIFLGVTIDLKRIRITVKDVASKLLHLQ